MKKVKTLFTRNWDFDPSFITKVIVPGLEFIVNNDAVPTRKFDGTCCMIKDGKLYKRHDRKKRGKKGKMLDEWKPEPKGWIPCEKDEDIGHWWGWAFVNFDEPGNWRYKEAITHVLLSTFPWYGNDVSIKNYDLSVGNDWSNFQLKMMELTGDNKMENYSFDDRIENDGMLKEEKSYIDTPRFFVFSTIPLPDGTYELCGPKVNGNPEHLDRHVLIPHGKDDVDFSFQGGNPYKELKAWFKGKDIEGIVWWKDGEPVAKIKKSDFRLKREMKRDNKKLIDPTSWKIYDAGYFKQEGNYNGK